MITSGGVYVFPGAPDECHECGVQKGVLVVGHASSRDTADHIFPLGVYQGGLGSMAKEAVRGGGLHVRCAPGTQASGKCSCVE